MLLLLLLLFLVGGLLAVVALDAHAADGAVVEGGDGPRGRVLAGVGVVVVDEAEAAELALVAGQVDAHDGAELLELGDDLALGQGLALGRLELDVDAVPLVVGVAPADANRPRAQHLVVHLALGHLGVLAVTEPHEAVVAVLHERLLLVDRPELAEHLAQLGRRDRRGRR